MQKRFLKCNKAFKSQVKGSGNPLWGIPMERCGWVSAKYKTAFKNTKPLLKIEKRS